MSTDNTQCRIRLDPRRSAYLIGILAVWRHIFRRHVCRSV